MLLVFIKNIFKNKKSHEFRHCTTIINLYAILKRKVKYLIIILRSSVFGIITIALFKKRLYASDSTDASLAKIVFTTDDIADVIKI